MNKTKEGGKNAAETTAPGDPIMMIEILENGILIEGCHHAIGKQMRLIKSKADALLAVPQPGIKIIGVA